MNERKSPDEEPIEDNFNEDFDFGESENETHPIKTTTTQGLNKKIVGVSVIVIFSVIVIMGYRIFKPAPKIKPAPLTRKEEVSPPPATTITTKAAPTTVTPPLEQNFKEITEAFSKTEHSETPPTIPEKSTVIEPTAIERNLQALEKELFTPEKPVSNAPSSQQESPYEKEISGLTQNLNKLTQQIEYVLNQIKRLDSYSQEISTNLNKLNDAISLLDNRLSALSNTTSLLSKDVGNVKSEVGQVKQVLKEDGLDINLGALTEKKSIAGKNTQIAIEGPEYIVHAVIPGRAWLKSVKGQIITVAEGDTIGNYGKILVIDATNGVVLTSSGVAFR